MFARASGSGLVAAGRPGGVPAGSLAEAGRAWCSQRSLAEDQCRGWLRATLANIAVSGFRRDAAFRDRLPQIEARYRKIAADTPAEAFASIAL